MFGPVGEIVRCHHERLDGRGYPRGLTGEDIPEVAKIVAVAEVYDTLTAPDTYRTPMNSFEALNELRRVSGTQLEGRYVEMLADLLSGTGTEYRHQDEASFDRELSMERRMSEAAARSPELSACGCAAAATPGTRRAAPAVKRRCPPGVR